MIKRHLKKSDKVSFASFLKSHNGAGLETKISLVRLCDFPDETLEGSLAEEKFSGLLVTTDLTKNTISKSQIKPYRRATVPGL